MGTTTFCQEFGVDIPQNEINDRINEIKTIGGALDAYFKKIGDKQYICAVYPVFDDPVEHILGSPHHAGGAIQHHLTGRPAAFAHVSPGHRPALLTEEDYASASAALGCEPAAIRAVAEVESGGRTGFLPDGRPKILFESHVFSRLTNHRFDDEHPDISTLKWTRNYVGGKGEYGRLDRAIQLDRAAALKAASWGKFQILGLNFARAGFTSVEDFVEAQKISEQEHLKAFVQFIVSHDLGDELHDKRWEDFARIYNGSRYAENGYGQKIREAYGQQLA